MATIREEGGGGENERKEEGRAAWTFRLDAAMRQGYALSGDVSFEDDGAQTIGAGAIFTQLPSTPILTLGMHTLEISPVANIKARVTIPAIAPIALMFRLITCSGCRLGGMPPFK